MCRCARSTGAVRLPERRYAPTAGAPQARVRLKRLARHHTRGHRAPVRPTRLCFQTSRAPARCAGAPQAAVRPHRRSAPRAPRALTPRGVVRRCAPSASAPQPPVRPERPARRRVRGPQVPVRPCDVRPELPRASPLAPSRPPSVRCRARAPRVLLPLRSPCAGAAERPRQFPRAPQRPPPAYKCAHAPHATAHPVRRCTLARVVPMRVCSRAPGTPVRLFAWSTSAPVRSVGGTGGGESAAPPLAVLGLCAISPPLLWRCRCGRCAPSTTPPSAPPSSSRCSADTRRWGMGVDAAPAAAPAPPRRTALGRCPNDERLPNSPTSPTGAGVTYTTQ